MINNRQPIQSQEVSQLKNSANRILTTHMGSLLRPPEIIDLMLAKESGQEYDREELAGRVRFQGRASG